MKKNLLLAAAALLAGSVLAADSSPKDDITAAAKKLADQANYSWRTTTVFPESSPFHPGPTDGKTEKEGFTHVTMHFNDNSTQALIKGDQAAVTKPDGGWQSLAEVEKEEGPGRFLAMVVRNLKTPAAEAAELSSFAKDLKKDGDAYSSDLTEEGAKNLLTFHRRNGGGDGPAVSGAKGSVKFWLTDGALSKYEFKLQGKMNFGGDDVDIERTTTVQIKDVGATKLTVPDEAKKNLS